MSPRLRANARTTTVFMCIGVGALMTVSATAQSDPALVSRQPVEARLPYEDVTQSYRLEVPADARYVEIRLVCGVADLDLDVYAGDAHEPMYTAETDAGYEMIEIDHAADPPLASGPYRVDVSYNLAAVPRWQGKSLREIPYSLVATVITDRVDGALQPGVPIASVLDDDSGRFRTYAIDVPADASVLRLDVTDTPGDVDMFLRRGRTQLQALLPAFVADSQLEPSLAPFIADLSWGCETLIVTAEESTDGLAGGWYLDVAEWHGRGSQPVPFRVHLSYSADVPEELAPLPAPVVPDVSGRTPQSEVPSMVELFSAAGAGTGTIVRADGVVVTCAHVVADLGGQSPMADVVVAVHRQIALPPVESFRARVVEFDAKRDIAVLKIDRGLYGQPLPGDYEFPAVRVATATPRLGAALWVLGFPASGGTGSRASITCSRGNVVGFERRGGHTMVKTDAAIHSGHSGGAAIDSDGRLVAIPSETQADDIGELGYLFPVYQLPAAWRQAWLAPK